jgi:hypothetical protein
MKTAIALVVTVGSLALLTGCPDNNPKPGATPAATGSGAPAANSAAPAASDKGGSGW